jgi:hypothetical protein
MSESKADYAEDEVWEAKQDDLFARGEGGAKEAFSILILDDSPYERECLVDMCQDQGYTSESKRKCDLTVRFLTFCPSSLCCS